MKNIDKIDMFSCGYCEYQVTSSKIMDIHTKTFHYKDKSIIVISVVIKYPIGVV